MPPTACAHCGHDVTEVGWALRFADLFEDCAAATRLSAKSAAARLLRAVWRASLCAMCRRRNVAMPGAWRPGEPESHGGRVAGSTGGGDS